MPQSAETHSQSTDTIDRAIEAVFHRHFEAWLAAAMKHPGFTATLKSLNKGHWPASGLMTVCEGFVEELPSGLYDAALQTAQGRVVLRNAHRTDRAADPQLIPSRSSSSFDAGTGPGELTAEQLLRQLTNAGANPPSSLLCAVELTRFEPSQHAILLPLLWQYILAHRNSNDRGELVAVGAAIRKYIAIMPMDRMGELAVLIESGHRSPLAIELEIEVAKMIYRNFEVHPPAVEDPQPELAQRLWEMVQAYVNPRILLRDKHSAAASLAIEAVASMRSPLAVQAWRAAAQSPYRWFAELVSDDLDDLHVRWSSTNPDAAAWLVELRTHVLANA